MYYLYFVFVKMYKSLKYFLQYSLSNDPNKPCLILTFNEVTMMLDCGLSVQTVLNFLPLSFVTSTRLLNLSNWVPHDSTDPELEGVCLYKLVDFVYYCNFDFYRNLRNVVTVFLQILLQNFVHHWINLLIFHKLMLYLFQIIYV